MRAGTRDRADKEGIQEKQEREQERDKEVKEGI